MSRYFLCTTILLIAGAVACRLSLRLSHFGFSGYNVSPMIDAGWRVYTGQVPGRDFVVTFPASLYLLTALCFRLYGVTWHAIALGTCWIYAVLLVLGLRVGALVKRVLGERCAVWTVLGFAAGQTILLVSINHLWHAALAQSFGLYAVYAAFVAVNVPAGTRLWTRAEALAHLALGSACLLLSKPNTAFPLILLCFAALMRARVPRRDVALTIGAAAMLAVAALAAVHVTPWGMLGAYVGLANRLVPKPYLDRILYAFEVRDGLANLLVYALLVPVIVPLLLLAWRNRARVFHDPTLVLGTGAILVSILGMGTNFDYKLTDAPLALFGFALVLLQPIPAFAPLRFRAVTVGCALLLLSLYFGRTRLRMQSEGFWAEENCLGRAFFDDRFLGHLNACPVVPATLAAVDRTLAAFPASRVFFGPSLEFLYAARGIRSPLHLPDWWDPGTSYPLRTETHVARSWENDNFDLLIFNSEEDRAQLPARVREDLSRNYVEVPGSGLIHVYRPR